MSLNVSKADMYAWLDYTTNPLAGKCPHDCRYCYMKRPPVCWLQKYKGDLRFDEKFKAYWNYPKLSRKKLSINRHVNLPFIPEDVPIIFVGSGNDLGVAPRDILLSILWRCNSLYDYYYFFQSKSLLSFVELRDRFPPFTIFGTTIETDHVDLCKKYSKAPPPYMRADRLRLVADKRFGTRHGMVSVEPQMKFNPDKLAELILSSNPSFVSIGADSGRNNLPESNWEEILELKAILEKETLVLLKDNLERIKGE